MEANQTDQNEPINEAVNDADCIQENDIFNIMITTDNHLGYKENDKIRANDSFAGFEECLKIGRNTPNLDFVLMGGDLFHEHKPSRKTFWKC
jgi:double-strand break repair protein MRE11